MENKAEPRIETIIITLDGNLMEGGSIEYKTFVEILDGTVGAIDGVLRISNYKNPIAFNVRPPKEKCFEISLQMVEWAGALVPLLPQAATIKDVVAFFIEYLKIKKSLKGQELKRENIQTGNNGAVTIVNNSGEVVYQDNRKIVNVNLIQGAQDDPQLNKKIDKIAKAIEENKQMDKLSYGVDSGESFQIPKAETEFYEYHEKIEQKPDSLVGYIRKIDNKTNKGVMVVLDGEKEKYIDFEIDIKDIRLLEKIVSNLAHAEADHVRVVFTGEKIQDSRGRLKKIIVNDVDIPDAKLGF